MKTRPIGERFQDGDVTLEVKKEVYGCDGCYYYAGRGCVANDDVAGGCIECERSDKKPVIFEKVEP